MGYSMADCLLMEGYCTGDSMADFLLMEGYCMGDSLVDCLGMGGYGSWVLYGGEHGGLFAYGSLG
jgi:hypothetical protein